jgi:hypothetical protein
MSASYKQRIPLLAVVFSIASLSAGAQPIVRGTQRLTSERPETWAIRYFTSITLLSGLGVPRWRPAGSVLIGAEGAWIPRLSTEQRRVGLNGTRLEDLNKAPVFLRPRLTIGMPGGIAATAAFVPPIEMFGVRSKLLALAFERSVHDSESWAMGLRAFGQVGTAEAAITCSGERAFPPGSIQNPSGCLAASSDVASLGYAGLELSAGGGREARVEPHIAVSANYLHNRFQTNARRFDFLDGVRTELIDRTVQRSGGFTVAATVGLGFRLGDRLDMGVDLFYAPLWVRRRAGAARQHDGLLTAKALLRYRIR